MRIEVDGVVQTIDDDKRPAGSWVVGSDGIMRPNPADPQMKGRYGLSEGGAVTEEVQDAH